MSSSQQQEDKLAQLTTEQLNQLNALKSKLDQIDSLSSNLHLILVLIYFSSFSN